MGIFVICCRSLFIISAFIALLAINANKQINKQINKYIGKLFLVQPINAAEWLVRFIPLTVPWGNGNVYQM